MDLARYRAGAAAQMREAALQAQIIDLAQGLHWRCYHTHDSRRSQPGWPDLVLASRQQGRVLFRELKRQQEKPTPKQQTWLDDLTAAGLDAGVWRPLDLIEGRIEADLRGHPGQPLPSALDRILAGDDPLGGAR